MIHNLFSYDKAIELEIVYNSILIEIVILKNFVLTIMFNHKNLFILEQSLIDP